MVSNALMVAVGAGFGVLARVIISNWIKRIKPGSFPLATFVVNMSGSFFLGIVSGFGLSASFSLLVGTGFLGSFTTFSTFNMENIELLRGKKYWLFLGYIAASYIVGVVLLLSGIALGKQM